MIRRSHSVKLPGVVAAALILVGWGLANEYLHVSANYIIGFADAVAAFEHIDTGRFEAVFQAGVYLMAAVAFSAAAAILALSIKKA
jgi:hypothetical protein